MSVIDTFETCRMTLRMSAYRDRPEVGKPVVKTTRLTHCGHRTKSYCLASAAPFEKSVDKRRRKGATPQPLRDERLWGDHCEEVARTKTVVVNAIPAATLGWPRASPARS